MPGASDNEVPPLSRRVGRYLRDEDEHEHCRCGARLLAMPWGRAPRCATCGLEEPACRCPPGACESCEVAPETVG